MRGCGFGKIEPVGAFPPAATFWRGNGKIVRTRSGILLPWVAAAVVGAGLSTTGVYAQPGGQAPATGDWRTGPPQPAPEPVVVIPGDKPPPEGQINALGAGLPAGPRAPYAPVGAPPPSANKRDLSGVWRTTQFVLVPLTTVTGEPLPYTAAGQNVLWHRQNMSTSGYAVISSTYVCRPAGILNSLNFGFPIELAQTDDTIAIMAEEGRGLLTIRMGGKHPDNLQPSFNGDAIGHWEGDALVVDIVGLNGEVNADWAGSPLSDKAHIVMRITRIDKGGPYEDLQALVSVDDPVNYTKPWTILKTYRWRPDQHLDEFDCEKGDQAANTEGLRLENPELIKGQRK